MGSPSIRRALLRVALAITSAAWACEGRGRDAATVPEPSADAAVDRSPSVPAEPGPDEADAVPVVPRVEPPAEPAEPVVPAEPAEPSPVYAPWSVWPRRELSTCWDLDEAEFAATEAARRTVRDAVVRVWQAHGELRFTGWTRCGDGAGFDLRVGFTSREPGVEAIGVALQGRARGIVLDRDPQYLERTCPRDADHCLGLQAAHAFGHALGFSHAKASDPKACKEPRSGTRDDLYVPPWIPASIMNACALGWDLELAASDHERAAYAMMYAEPSADHVRRATRVDRAFPREPSLWKSRTIPVCWEPGSDCPEEQEIVRQAIARTWEAHSAVRFSGWGECGEKSDGIRIQVADRGPRTVGLGTALAGKRNGMLLNLVLDEWEPSCTTDEDERRYCIEILAIHEFGHALGFAHEQNRDDTPGDCAAEPQGSSGTYQFGAWDRESVMNYCNPRWNGDGKLSQTDIAALQFYYGKPEERRDEPGPTR